MKDRIVRYSDECKVSRPFGGSLGAAKATQSTRREVRTRRLSQIISRKPGGVGAASQRLLPRGPRCGFAHAHRGDGKRFVVRANEKQTEPAPLITGSPI